MAHSQSVSMCDIDGDVVGNAVLRLICIGQ